MSLKEECIKSCELILNNKEAELLSSENSARQSAAAESKSSAGDKHETARELIHQEREIITQRLNELYKQRNELDAAKSGGLSDRARQGSLLHTSIGYFFLGPALGFVKVGDTRIACVSISSPIGMILLGKKSGSSVVFRTQPIRIISIE